MRGPDPLRARDASLFTGTFFLQTPAIAQHLLFWAATIAPLIYLAIDPTHYNKDDNFSQFSPVFRYAYDALFSGTFPWITPVDYGVRLAQAPYYALFSPLLLASGLVTKVLHLPIYWTVNLWVLLHLALINGVLVRFTRTLDLPDHLRAAIVLSASSATFMSFAAVNWYYTLPYLLLLVTKLHYWNQVLSGRSPNRRDDGLLLSATWLAILGGNPQLLVYTYIAEGLVLLPMARRTLIKPYVNMLTNSALMLAPFIYCHLRYWNTSWRTLINNGVINLDELLRIGLLNPLDIEGPSIWLWACVVMLIFSMRRKSEEQRRSMATALAAVAVMLLSVASSEDLGIYANQIPIFRTFTTPFKWWFFGGVLAVFAVALQSQKLRSNFQITLSILAWLTSILYLHHSVDRSFFAWDTVNYSHADVAIQIVQQHLPENSRILQVSPNRVREAAPDRALILNTWLAHKSPVLMVSGYESMQPTEAKHYSSANPYTPQSLVDAGIAGIWVNANHHEPDEFPPGAYNLVYQDEDNFLMLLKTQGRIVTCATPCNAKVDWQPDRIGINFEHPAQGSITVRINPLSNYWVEVDGKNLPTKADSNGWLSFEANGNSKYAIRYHDDIFIGLLIFSYAIYVFLLFKLTKIFQLLSIRFHRYLPFTLILALVIAFASYDLMLIEAGNATSLLNVRVSDGYRFDEAYMYIAGVGKTIFYDPYLKEHATALTLRPTIPVALFSMIYRLCLDQLDLAIFIGHTAFPLLSCLLLYLIGLQLTGSKKLAVLSMLLGVGHYVFSSITLASQIFGLPNGEISGPDLWLLKQILGDHWTLGNINAPNQFTRLFSPALTLPFLLYPLLLQIKERAPALRGAMIAANLYVYPHHIIFLGIIEIAFWIKNRKIAPWSFFFSLIFFSTPYIAQHLLVLRSGVYSDIYHRIGHINGLSFMWFFAPYFAITSYFAWKKGSNLTVLAFNYSCLACVLLIWAIDTLSDFPQVHLIGLRIFVFLAPLALITTLKTEKSIIKISISLLSLILISSIYAGWLHRNEYSNTKNNIFIEELRKLPSKSVVMTEIQSEVAYISAGSDKYSYVAYGIVSSASNAELLERFAIIAKIYDWSLERMYGGDWDGLQSVPHWIYHHGAPSISAISEATDLTMNSIKNMDKCQSLRIFEVDYIRFTEVPPNGLEKCTQRISNDFLKVTPL